MSGVPNPYQTSSAPGGSNAADMVKAPAMTLLIVMSICMVLVVLGLILNLVGVGLGAAAAGDSPEGMQAMLSGGIGIVSSLVGLVVGSFIIFGSLKMMKLQSYGMAMAACILAALPIVSPCCCIGLPVGIWGVIVLNKPEVKAAFR